MKKSTIGIVITSAFVVAARMIMCRSDKAARAASKEEAKEQLDGPAIKLARDEVKACEDILNSEQRTIDERVESWEKQNKYRWAAKNIQKEADKQIRMMEIDPDNTENRRLIELQDKQKDALASSKKALGLAKAEKDRDRAIAAATEKYEKQAAILSASSGDAELNGIASVLRSAAEKDKDNAIKEANKRYDALKAKYDAKVEEWEEKILNAKTVREETLAEGRRKILAIRDARISDLRKQHSDAISNIRNDVVNARSDEETDIIDRCDSNQKLIDSWGKNIDKTADDIYKSKSRIEKVSAFLAKNKITPGMVLAIGCTPFVGISLIAWEYGKFLIGIVKHMKGA